MTNAEPVEHDGYELPNWLTKCKDILTAGPALTLYAAVLLAAGGFTLWNHNRPAYSEAAQSQPDTTTQLNVLPSSGLLPPSSAPALPLPSGNAAPSAAPPGGTMPTPSNQAPVGPAPTTSAQSLQPTGTAAPSDEQTTQSLTGAITTTTQAAGAASGTMLRGLGL